MEENGRARTRVQPRSGNTAATIAPLVRRLAGDPLPFRLEFWDGSVLGPSDAPSVVRMRSPTALRRLLTAPGELGLARAYVAGDLEIEGDLEPILEIGVRRPDVRLGLPGLLAAARSLVAMGALRPGRLPPPPEEARLRGRLHSKARDRAAIAHHYDVSNDFYRLVLGPTLTYSCGYFRSPGATLEDAQIDKNELVCRKLALRRGDRVLDVGCGWGTFAIHAATRHGVEVVGVTISERQAELAAKRVADAGMADRVTIRLQDERDVDDGPYDAIASIGMFEHVGRERLAAYFDHLRRLLRPQGRLLNHGITRTASPGARRRRRTFINRYVFPDGELHELGTVLTVMERAGLEVRDVEGLRDHYPLTLRRWVGNLEANRDEAVALVGEGRYRVWRLFMAGSARMFEAGRLGVHQVLAVKPDGGQAGFPLRRDLAIPS